MKLLTSHPKNWSASQIRRTLHRAAVVGISSALAACGGPAPVTHSIAAPASAVVSSQPQSLPPQDVPTNQSEIDAPYVLGPDDIISISVYDHPELSSPQPGVTGGSGGVMITSDGTVGLPLIGNVVLGGLTIDQAQQKLVSAYAADVNQPDVTVQLVNAQSLRYYLLGAFSTPGVKYPGHVLTLLEALSLGGSVDLSNADLYQAYVADGATKIPVDLNALLREGDMTQNIVLNPGATVVIPPASTEDAFVFGAVGKPGPVPFTSGELSLVQALSSADLDLPNYASARLGQVHIIRSHGASADFIVVDAAKIIGGEALPFELEPGDVVFVPPTDVASWNQVLDMLLPSLNTISGVLNPFVSIAYLSRKN